jgi:hypothetical protein
MKPWAPALILRTVAALSLARGLFGTAAIVGIRGTAPFETLSLADQIRTVIFSVGDIAAGTALWLLAPWGMILWGAVSLVQAGAAALDGYLVGLAGHSLLVLAVYAVIRTARRTEAQDDFRFS